MAQHNLQSQRWVGFNMKTGDILGYQKGKSGGVSKRIRPEQYVTRYSR